MSVATETHRFVPSGDPDKKSCARCARPRNAACHESAAEPARASNGAASAEPASTARMMAPTREGQTIKLELADATHGGVVEGYVTGNLGRDGRLREVFLHGFGKEGSTLDGWTQFAAILLSLGLQAGVDFAGLARRVAQMRFEPYGATRDPNVPWAPSVPAYIVAWLALRFGDEAEVAAIREVMAEWRP